jgi:hypothetical protein
LTALNAAVPKIYIPAYMKIEAINEYWSDNADITVRKNTGFTLR